MNGILYFHDKNENYGNTGILLLYYHIIVVQVLVYNITGVLS